MRQRFLPILFLAALLGCSKSDSNPIIDFGEGEGITYRDNTARPSGPQDPTDWTSDGEWNKQERELFADLNLDLNGPQQPAAIERTYVYPNPAMGNAATWTLQLKPFTSTPVSYTSNAVLVDRNYRVRLRFGPQSFAGGYSYMFDYARAGISPNELYRIYYVVYNASGLVYKGHGDIRYSPQ
jgi:hypothetical protein